MNSTQFSQPDNETTDKTSASGPIAAIDIGSNSFHLITARINNGALQPLVADKQIVRLADGLGSDGILSEEAIERGLDVLRNFALTIADIPADSIRVVGTFTLRRAKNAHEFVRRARDFMPVPVEIISGDEEARLIYQGIAHTIHNEGQRLVVDIGGGSTEFAIGKSFSVLQLSSQPLGCVVFTRKFFPDGKITLDAFRAAEIAACQRLEVISDRFQSTGWNTAFGSSGTVKAIGQYLQTTGDDFDGKITLNLLQEMKASFIDLGKTKKLVDVDEPRRAVLPAGLAILIAIFEQLGIEELQISEAALREGVLYELPDRMRHHDIRERTVDSLVQRYDVDITQVQRVEKTMQQLFTKFGASLNSITAEASLDFLRWAVSLHEIGLQINRRAIQRHSAYIVKHAELPGFSKEEQELLSLLLETYRKRFQRDAFKNFDMLSQKILLSLAAILRLSILLNIRRLDDFLPEIEAAFDNDQLHLIFPNEWLAENSLVQEDLKMEAKNLAQNDFTLTWR